MDQDVLLTFGEVGIAIAGFSGIVVSLGRRAHGDWSEKDRRRLLDLLSASLGAAIFGFLPIVLSSVGMSDRLTLRYASAALLAYILFSSAMWLRGAMGELRWMSWVLAVPTLLNIAMLALVALDVIFRVATFAYYLTLFWLLLLSAANFARLLVDSDLDQ